MPVAALPPYVASIQNALAPSPARASGPWIDQMRDANLNGSISPPAVTILGTSPPVPAFYAPLPPDIAFVDKPACPKDAFRLLVGHVEKPVAGMCDGSTTLQIANDATPRQLAVALYWETRAIVPDVACSPMQSGYQRRLDYCGAILVGGGQ